MGLSCGVITPIGPGHAEIYRECRASIERATARSQGPFERVDIVSVDDTKAELGRSRARNAAVRRCAELNVDWLFFLDADDLMSPEAFRLVEPLVGDYDAIWGLIVEQMPEAANVVRLPQAVSLDSLDELVVFDPYQTLQMGHFVRTAAAVETPFDESMDSGEDFDYYLRLWRAYRCVKRPLELFVNRRRIHSVGPRSASGRAWGETVRPMISRERSSRNLGPQSTRAIALGNRCVAQLQKLLQEHKAECDYLEISRQMPLHAFVDVTQYSGRDFVMFCGNDDATALSLAWTGAYEPVTTRLWQRLAVGSRTVLDLGASTGIYCFLAASVAEEATSVGFEPVGRNDALFLRNKSVNRFSNVHPVWAVVCDTNGSGQIRFNSTQDLLPCDATLATESTVATTEIEVVPSFRIDDFFRQNTFPLPDLVRISVNGAEGKVLAGMAESLESAHPDLLMACSPSSDTTAVTEQLQRYGYRFYAIREKSAQIGPSDGVLAGGGPGDRNRLASVRPEEDILGTRVALDHAGVE